MHLVIDLNDNSQVIVEIGYTHPRVHRQCIAGCGKTILTKDFIRKGLAAFKFVGVITGDPELYFNRLLVLPEYSSRK
jgi:hypothetical protein